MKVGLVGAGALGLLVASRLALSGQSPLVFVRTGSFSGQTSQVIQFQELGDQVISLTLSWTDDPAHSGDIDVLIVLVPSWATREALQPFAVWLQPTALIVSLQNGIGNDTAIRAVLPGHDPSLIALGVTGHGAWRLSPHSVIHAGSGETTIGLVAPGRTALLQQFADVLSAAGIETRVTDAIMPFVWQKLTVSAAINGLTAATGLPNGAIANEPDLAAIAVAIAGEVASVARSLGIDIDTPGQHVIDVALSTAANRSSMLSSLEAGRRTEVDAIHGAVVEIAKASGIEAPLIAMLAAIIRGREQANARSRGSDHDQ